MPNALKQFGAKGIDSLSGRFHHARVRLTLMYVLILTAILFVSSYTIYSNFSGRLEHRFEGFQPGFQRMYQPDAGSSLVTVPSPDDVRTDLVHTLIIVNGLLLICAGIFSYWLAGLTLEPIQAAYNRQRRFLGDASHELRTPLAILQTDLENELEDEAVKGASRERAESQLEEVQRMGRLVSDLLVLSRLDEVSDIKPVAHTVLIGQVLVETVSRLQGLAEANDVSLRLVPFEADLDLPADKELLMRVFANLVKNAIIYNTKGGSVTVGFSRDGDFAAVTVADTGIGISKADIGRISERFYRADKSRSRQTGGSGLGLAIVRAALDQLGGSMSVESRVGEGTSVSLFLPFQRFS